MRAAPRRCRQLVGLERLRDEAIRARRLRARLGVAPGRHHDHRYRRRRRPARSSSSTVEPAHDGQHQVEDDEIRREFVDEGSSAAAVGRLDEAVAAVEAARTSSRRLGSSSQMRIVAPAGSAPGCLSAASIVRGRGWTSSAAGRPVENHRRDRGFDPPRRSVVGRAGGVRLPQTRDSSGLEMPDARRRRFRSTPFAWKILLAHPSMTPTG